MKNTKTVKVVMLATEKASTIGLHLRTTGNPLHKFEFPNDSQTYKNQHLYIISDDEIKEGDYGMGYAVGIKGKGAGHYIFRHDGSSIAKVNAIAEGSKKIVATTDQELTNCSVCGSDNTYHKMDCQTPSLRTNIPAIPTAFVEAYIKSYNDGSPITEVAVEVYGDRPLTIGATPDSLYLRNDNTVIIHQSKLYTREDMIKFGRLCREGYTRIPIEDVLDKL